MNKQKLFFYVFLATFFLDQLSKFLASFFEVNMSYNTGISFSKLSQSDPQFLTFILLILVYLLFKNFKQIWKENNFAAGLFFGGAVANLFDRLIFGAVRDWIYIPFTQIHNNFADWAIFIGLVLLLYPIVTNKYLKN
jgi:lipoprotein signal peptidase